MDIKKFKINGEIVEIKQYSTQINKQENNFREFVQSFKAVPKAGRKKSTAFSQCYKMQCATEYENLKNDIYYLIKRFEEKLEIEDIMTMFNITDGKLYEVFLDLVKEGKIIDNEDEVKII